MLPHALLHFPEIVARAGHHAGSCTFLAEVSHKDFIKTASKLGRTYGSRNRSEVEMLQWSLRDKLYVAAIRKSKRSTSFNISESESETTDDSIEREFTNPVSFLHAGGVLYNKNRMLAKPWENTMISKRVRVVRRELLTLVCAKLSMSDTRENRTKLTKLLTWECYGVLNESRVGLRRKFVGLSDHFPNRRDFVRIKGSENNTCLTAELIMFVTLSGFSEDSNNGDIVLPRIYRNPTQSLELALVRWLSPHPNSLIRDSNLRPICSAPLDINHALWTYSRRARNSLTPSVIRKHFDFFDGDSPDEKQRSVDSECDAYLDLIQVECIQRFVNCTPINRETETHTILETITIPF